MRRPLAAAALIFTGLVRLLTWIFPLPVPISGYEDGQQVICEGEVADIVSWSDTGTGKKNILIYLENSDVFISDSAIINVDHSDKESFDKKIICKCNETEEIPEIGCRVKYRGLVSNFRKASNPGEFDSAIYYGRQGYSFQLNQAVLMEKSAGFDWFRQELYKLKNCMGESLELFMSDREASVIKAMLLGEKKGLDKGVKEIYQRAGISHVLAISGLHISMIGMGAYRILVRFIGKKFSCLSAAGLLAAFLMMTGFSPSALRAGIMFLLGMTARLIGRTYDAPTALAVAAALLLADNPAWLEDSGFQLSFLAAAGAVAVLPLFAEMEDLREWILHHRKESGGAGRLYREKHEGKTDGLVSAIKGGLLPGICIHLITLPVMASSFYEWNMFSLIINLAVIPLMGFLMGGSIILAAGGALFTALAPQLIPFLLPLSIPIKAILYFYEKICLMELSLPAGLIRSGKPENWQIIVFYLGLLGILCLSKKIPRVAGIISAILLSGIFLIRPTGGVQMTMLDVGQGECIYIETENGHDYLYDGGSTSKNDTGTWQIIPFLKYEGVTRLELIFVSHCDKDHISGIPEILEYAANGNLEVGGIVLAAGSPDDEMRSGLIYAAEKAGVAVYQMGMGDVIKDGECRFEAVYPDRENQGDDRNAASLVIRFAREDRNGEVFSALFTGDVEAEGEKKILRQIPETGILDVAHHGSETSSCADFLDRIKPDLALISCGENNSYGHPHEDVLYRFRERKIPVLVTAQAGAITVRQRGERITVETFRH